MLTCGRPQGNKKKDTCVNRLNERILYSYYTLLLLSVVIIVIVIIIPHITSLLINFSFSHCIRSTVFCILICYCLIAFNAQKNHNFFFLWLLFCVKISPHLSAMDAKTFSHWQKPLTRVVQEQNYIEKKKSAQRRMNKEAKGKKYACQRMQNTLWSECILDTTNKFRIFHCIYLCFDSFACCRRFIVALVFCQSDSFLWNLAGWSTNC